MELSLFVVQQKENEQVKEYLQRFNAAGLEVSSATQEVKASAFSQGILDGDFFKSLAKKPISKFDSLLAHATKYINMEDAQAAKKESLMRAKIDAYFRWYSRLKSIFPQLASLDACKNRMSQKENEQVKEYLQRFNAAGLEVPSATQEVKASAFSQGLLDGDFFKSLAKKRISKFDSLLARAAKYINIDDA
ncbi:UNVERIFIED_CONTAM: hypothetical protein Scaly_2314200 [Sesamum calycinum]|uniref:Retrotransposon gag domain-containing protein n=1 Tax=Sesamum calycinum TaxID=2727403 RepID=A0AAW2MCM3_9LAMI